MIYITNWWLVQKYLINSSNVNIVIVSLSVTKILFKRYWKKLRLFLSVIEKQDSDLFNTIKLLITVWKLNTKDINSILNLLKKQYSWYKEDVVLVWNSVDKLYGSMQNKFDDVSLSEKKDFVWISIDGENNYYRRSLDVDIDKLLD
jgi:hypothetical protein